MEAWLVVGWGHYVALSVIIFLIGIAGIYINRKNIITLLLSIELIVLAVVINFVTFATYRQHLHGHIFALVVMTVAAAESAIALALLVAHYRHRHSIAVEDLQWMKG